MKEFKIQRMEEVLLESLIGNDDILDEEKQLVMERMYGEENPISMYVLSNKNKHYGAIGIMDRELMEQFRQKVNNDFYIILSSIHEMILVPDVNLEQSELKEMICSVIDEEILSYNLYLYEYRTGEIRLSS